MKAKSLIFVCPLLLTLACNDKKKFGGAVESAKTPAVAETEKSEDSIVKPSDEGPATIPSTEKETPAVELPKCEVGESEVTQVKLLTTGVNLAIENQEIDYEISVLSCKDGSVVPINDQSIFFDLDLRYSGKLPAIAYSIVDSATKESIVSGDLQVVNGSDLFGKVGAGYTHWKTESVSFTSKVEKVHLIINLKKAKLNTYEKNSTTADSYLRMGKASAVTQPIAITGQP